MCDFLKKRDQKMDQTAVRTAAQLEQKLGVGKSFAKAIGAAEDAREEADKANQDIKNMFAKDIMMTGTFVNEVETYLPPTDEVINAIEMHFIGEAIIPDDMIKYYDFNGDGELDSRDCVVGLSMKMGLFPANFPTCVDPTKPTVAKKTKLKLMFDLKNPDKLIRITGTNMWGGEVDKYIGVNFTNIETRKSEETVDYVVERSERTIIDNTTGGVCNWITERWNSGFVKITGHITNCSVNITQPWGNVYRSGGVKFYLPYVYLVPGFISVIHNASGLEQAVWGGQAYIENTTEGRPSNVVVEAFCGNAATVTTNFYIEVTGKWK